ncbi:hypothetical protein [Halomicronema sp. CCY15110]|uniref:NACHT C-terminal helical domain 2-containing protein n=1 Tax=Halomicronema sp. CCY15110 TaxID=2767773 RepID=UPI0019503CB7|nr:hypothetical protein [Halomicronema sp. CCY15110]
MGESAIALQELLFLDAETGDAIQALTDCFYTLELMVRCKEAAVRVSPQVWAGIESRILTVPPD